MKLSGPERFRRAATGLGLAVEVFELPGMTRTAPEAAAALGCSVGEIAKSLVFRGKNSDRPVLAIMSGANRVDLDRLAKVAGEGLGKADAAFVRDRTGFAIGGVPPFGHAEPIAAFQDEDLLAYQTVWAAAGGPFALFEISPLELEQASGARRAVLKETG